MADSLTREDLRTAFEYSWLHDDWVNPLQDALEGVTAEQALWRPPAPEAKGIWDIVLHLAVWNENIVERVETGQAVRPAEGAWPAAPKEADEQVWEASKRRLWDSIERLRDLVENAPIEKIRSSYYGMGDFLCRFLHMAYHGGQITKLRECMGW